MTQKPERASQQPSTDTEVPNQVYANSVGFNFGAFDLFMDFALRTPENPSPQPLVRVHMSIQHAWVMAKILDRLFAQYRQTGGRFTIPEPVLNELGLTEEYKEDMGE